MTEPSIEVLLLTGFLGSGKTTLLQRLLHLPEMFDTAVLINEFGAVGLDHHLIRHTEENVVMLANGCVCCTVRDDLGAAIRDLLRRRAAGDITRFSRLVIETTGLADPTPILHTLLTDPVLDKALAVRSIVATVDAVNAALHLARQPESIKQIAVADTIVLTKTDLVPDADAAATAARLRSLNPAARLLHAQELSPPALLEGRGYQPATGAAAVREWLSAALFPTGDHRHDHSIAAGVLELDDQIEWGAFGVWMTMLLHRHGADILRLKGILNVAGATGPVAVHGVQHLVHPPVHLDAWPDDDRRSRLVLITRGIAIGTLRNSLFVFNRAARRLTAPDALSRPVMNGAGAEVGGRPYRRRGALAWTR